jgi:hypothetical protein
MFQKNGIPDVYALSLASNSLALIFFDREMP